MMAGSRVASGWAGASIVKGVGLAESPEEGFVGRVPALLRCASSRRMPAGHGPCFVPILCPCRWLFSNKDLISLPLSRLNLATSAV